MIEPNNFYNYIFDGEDKSGIVMEISSPIRGTKYVIMDNGDQIPVNIFEQTCELVENPEAMMHQRENQMESMVVTDQDKITQSSPENVRIQTDKDGFPILQTEQNEQQDNKQIAAPNNKVSPVTDLLIKAKKVDEEITINMPIQVIDKDLFNVIRENFGEESIDEIFDFLMKSVKQADIRKAISEKLREHYGAEIEK